MCGLKFFASIFALAVSTGTAAQSSPSMMIRAIRPDLGSDAVAFIARNARPFNIGSPDLGGSALTGRDIAKRLCGTFYETYWRVVQEFNKGNAPPLDKPVSDAGSYAWPRCLYAEQFPDGRKVVVKQGDSAALIYRRFTGSAGAGTSLAKYFGVATAADVANLKVGQTVNVAYRTIPVSITPADDDRLGFEEKLKRAVTTAGGSPEATYVVSEPAQGRIVVAAPTLDYASRSQGTPVCAPFSAAPIDPGAIMRAYRRAYEEVSRRNPGDTPDRAKVVVVDNGFFGAFPDNINNNLDPFAGSPFPPGYFRKGTDGTSLLAQRIYIPTTDVQESGQPKKVNYVDPINFVHLLAVNEISGHGTHVTGLVLGGPHFAANRDKLRQNSAPWAEVTILNVGKGDEGLLTGAHTHLRTALTETQDPGYVVNMSVAYEHDVYGMWSVFDALRSNIGGHGLFVVAAGNDGKLLSTMALLPGSMGGTVSQNILTVAAHDANGRVMELSNRDDVLVDIAAPGCGIHSWLSNADHTTPMDGTSMATPLVTFAASLLRSLLKDPPGRELKARLIASGDLLPEEDWDKTNYGGIKLNVAKALYWFDDYLRVGDDEFLGTLVQLPASARRCVGKPAAQALNELWSFKRRADGSGVLHLGKLNGVVQSHCKVQDLSTGDLVFRATHQITRGEFQPLPAPADQRFPMKSVNELVLRSR